MNDADHKQMRTLWLVARAGDAEREFEVRFAADATVSELATLVAAELSPGVETTWTVTSQRSGTELSLDASIVDSGLVSGDGIELRSEARAESEGPASPSSVDLVVVGGPLVGARYRLEPGSHVVGRGSGSDVKIDDPSMSRRHLEVTVDGGRVTVSDAGSTNGTFIDGERLGEPRSLAEKDVLEAGGSLLSFEPAARTERSSTSAGIEVPFNRPPRVHPAQRSLNIALPEPPDEPSGPRIPIAVSVVPLIVGIVMLLLFPENKAMLLFFAMTPVIAVWSFFEERRSGTRAFRVRRDEFLAELEVRESHLDTFVREEIEVRRDAFPDAAALVRRVEDLAPRLWERRPGDGDFLSIRVGWGDEPSTASITHPSSGSRALRDEAAERLRRFTTLRAVPVVVDLLEAGTTALCGDPDDVRALARWAIVQIAALHSPDEVQIGAVLPGDAAPEWDWLKWLPHVGGTAERPRVAFGPEALHLVEQLDPGERGTASIHTVVVIDANAEVPRSALGRILRAPSGAPLSVLWLGSDPRALPGESRAVVEVDNNRDLLAVTLPGSGHRAQHQAPEGIGIDTARSVARALCPVRDSSIGKQSRTLPTVVSLWDALGIGSVSSSDVARRWNNERPERPVGLGVSGEGAFHIDLRRDGPHGLIGGTTGAGKSELLQSMIAALAFDHSPERVNLLLVDYKGGTAFARLETLPHVVATVTDLDPHLASRALMSLEAELKRRERILAEHRARDVVELAAMTDSALPDLVLVVDEFATLVAELPEFVDGIVDVAQRGRALGLHLILATQKPAGVVSDKIRANTNLRIALRMSDESDSMDVIGLPDAAHIPRSTPGRGYVRTGHGEVTEIQSAISSVPAPGSESPSVVLRRLGPDGPEPDRAEIAHDTTQLSALIEAVQEAAAALPQPHSPLLPPLPAVLPLEQLPRPSRAMCVPIGLRDEPTAQRQDPVELNLQGDASVLVFGAGGSGKTTLLRTIAASIATHHSPDDVHIYALDLGTRGLGPLQGLPHCGAVVFAEEEERIRRLFSMLRDEIVERRSIDDADRPRIVVLLDGYAGFAAAFERVDFGEMVDALPRLVADGRQVGIHFAITADRRGAVPAALTGIISNRIVLRLADDDEYSSFGLSARSDRDALATRGRAFLHDGTLMQSAVAGNEASLTDQVDAIEKIAVAGGAATRPPQPVQALPARVPLASLDPEVSIRRIPVGIDERGRPALADVTDGHFLVVGPRRSGRSTALAACAHQIRKTDADTKLHLLAPRRLDVDDDFSWTSTAVGQSACEDWLGAAYELVHDMGAATVLIDDGDELFESLSSDSLQRAIKWARDNEVRFIVAVEAHAAQRAFGGWFAELKKDKTGLLLQPDIEVDGDLLGIRLPRRKLRFPPGRGYLVGDGDAQLIQVAQRDDPSQTS